MNAPRTALHGQATTITRSLYVAFELDDRRWKLSLGNGGRAASRCMVVACDTAAVLKAISKAKARCHLATKAPVRSCYEAGRDGFWLHRCLETHQITNLVVGIPGESWNCGINQSKILAAPPIDVSVASVPSVHEGA